MINPKILVTGYGGPDATGHHTPQPTTGRKSSPWPRATPRARRRRLDSEPPRRGLSCDAQYVENALA